MKVKLPLLFSAENGTKEIYCDGFLDIDPLEVLLLAPRIDVETLEILEQTEITFRDGRVHIIDYPFAKFNKFYFDLFMEPYKVLESKKKDE